MAAYNGGAHADANYCPSAFATLFLPTPILEESGWAEFYTTVWAEMPTVRAQIVPVYRNKCL